MENMLYNYTNEELMEQGEFQVFGRGIYTIYEVGGDTPNVVALKGLNFEIKRGEFVSALGPSGSGKSSLMRCIGGLQKPNAGSIKYGNLDITKLKEEELVSIRRNSVGFVFQSPTLIQHLSAKDNVINTLRYSGNSLTDAKKRTNELLDLLGISHRGQALPNKLSGGERQRVGIAVALANNPSLILADEPTGNLDHENTANVMGLFQDLHNDLDTSFLIVTHSKYVSTFADRNLELMDGIFLGQHTGNINLDSLESSRQILIGNDGRLNLPPELIGLIDEYGSAWNLDYIDDKEIPEIKLTPVNKNEKEINNFTTCPLCSTNLQPNQAYCTNCGAQLIN
ncbi:MAG: ABC transporter ATP-binding protein [Candidatus Kariarchaeum pelagius]